MSVPACTHRPPCPGCPRYGERGLSPARLATLRDLASSTGAQLDDVVEGDGFGYRVRARLAVRGRASSPKVGIFQAGTHDIVDIPSCTIHHPAVNRTARALKTAIRTTGTRPYADRPHAGLLRYVQVVVERPRGSVQVVLVTSDVDDASAAPLARALREAMGNDLQGLWWNGNPDRTNTIFGPHWKKLAGEDAVRETIGGASVFFPPGAFGQGNLDLADRLVADLHSRVPDDAVVAELYCGVGAIGLGLVARSREVRFNEVNPHGLRGLAMGIDALPPGARDKASVTGGAAAAALAILDGAECVVVDPPRKGLEDEVVGRLRDTRPERLLYVSCELESLVRDAASLAPSLRLVRLTPYALFPNTDHVETLAEFAAH